MSGLGACAQGHRQCRLALDGCWAAGCGLLLLLLEPILVVLTELEPAAVVEVVRVPVDGDAGGAVWAAHDDLAHFVNGVVVPAQQQNGSG